MLLRRADLSAIYIIVEDADARKSQIQSYYTYMPLARYSATTA